MSWKTVALGEVCKDVQSGFASGLRDEQGVIQIRMNNVSRDGGLNFDKICRVPVEDKKVAKYSLESGDVLFNMTNSPNLVGKSTIFRGYVEPVVFSNHFLRVRTTTQILDSAYLTRWLTFQYLRGRFEGMCTQWVNQASVRKEDLLKLQIPLPPLDEQKRIAAILDKADATRAKRRQTIAQLDALLQAVFLDMFGDPVTNPKGWNKGVLGDVIHSAKDGPHVSPSYAEEGIPFLSTRHVRPGRIVWEDLKYISQEEAELHWKKCKPERGDILYTKGGTTGIAKVVDVDTPFAVWVHIALLKPNHQKVNAIWLENMLNSKYCYEQSQRFTHGIANRDLGLTRMTKIQLYIPPIELQNQFASHVAKIESLKAKAQSSSTHLDALFASLQHRAFRGEL